MHSARLIIFCLFVLMISSFSEFARERTYLLEHTYPSLKEYFQKNFNFDFQVRPQVYFDHSS